jgi:aspartyl-tRNA(Asn)/glutamyl-tRNA(Gln) amidotransferase subunit A
MYLADIFTIAANLAGICGISLPCGFAEVDGAKLPIGLQLLGKPSMKRACCNSPTRTSRACEWCKARPAL